MNLHQKCEVCGSVPPTREIKIIVVSGKTRVIRLCGEKKCLRGFLRRAEMGIYDGPPNNGKDAVKFF